MNKKELTKKILIEGIIVAKSGLHIGGTNLGLSIGSTDNTVVRNPVSNEPYIPGSTLKGKMRTLLEQVEGKWGDKTDKNVQVGPYTNIDDDTTDIPKIFGTMPEKIKNEENKQHPTRLIVRDCELGGVKDKDKFITRVEGGVDKLLNSKNTDMPYTEVKTEVVIDRITAQATPRQLERVPAGTFFNMRLILNVYKDDKEENFINKIFEGLTLVQNDYLGGKGTRGSGEIDILVQKLKYKDRKTYEEQNDWQEYDALKIPEILNGGKLEIEKVTVI